MNILILKTLVLLTLGIAFVGGEWISMDPSKDLPRDCHIGGNEETSSYRGLLHIGRKQVGNELVIGKVIDSWKSGYFSKDGNEHWSDHYEVFCGGSISWISIKNYPAHLVRKNFVQGGSAGDGEPFYICRGTVNGALIPGKYYIPTSCCYVASGGKEVCAEDPHALKQWY